MLPFLVAGCASWQRPLDTPPEVTPQGVAARLLAPPGRNGDPAETVVKPGTPGEAPSNPLPGPRPEPEPTTFALPDAIAFALRNSPRLRSARAAIERARGQEPVAFAPFLPQIDLLGQYGVVSSTLAPGKPGSEGFLLANGDSIRNYAETEVGLQWTLYDFGRTGGRYRQAVAREAIAELQLARAAQTVEFDVAAAYLDVQASAGHTDGHSVITGWQEGAGLHLETPLYAGGRHRGELRSADADVEAALADAQGILDAISLQVNLAYRAVVAASQRIELSRTAVVQAREDLRRLTIRYRNGNATPTDLVDAQAALTRSQQRFFSASYLYLARLDYALGQHQGTCLTATAPGDAPVLPRPVPAEGH